MIYFSLMLAKYALGQTVDELDSIDLTALILLYPRAAEKIGCGIRRFFVGQDDHGGYCFWIERIDGTKTDFSLERCITRKDPSLYQQFSEAFHEAVRRDLYDTKQDLLKQQADGQGRIRCRITGELAARDEVYLAHLPPMTFANLVEKFIIDHGIVPDQSMLSVHKDGQTGPRLKDPALAELFRAFHREHSNLGIVKRRRKP